MRPSAATPSRSGAEGNETYQGMSHASPDEGAADRVKVQRHHEQRGSGTRLATLYKCGPWSNACH